MRLNVRNKLMVATGVVFTLVIMVSLIGIWSIWRVGMGVVIIENHCIINRCWNTDIIQELKASFEKTIITVHDYVGSGEKKHIEEFKKSLKILTKRMEDALKTAKSLDEPQFITLKSTLNMIKEEIWEIESLSRQIFAEHGSLDRKAMALIEKTDAKKFMPVPDPLRQDPDRMMKKLDITSRAVTSQLDSMFNLYREDTRATLEKANKLRFKFAIIMVVIFFILALAILGSGILLAKEITTPIRNLVKATQRVASGELTCKVTVSSQDEIGELANYFNLMTEDLQKYQNKLLANERLATLGTFVSYVSHELKNPLSVLLNCVFYLETLNNGNDHKLKKYLKMMREEIDAAKKIVDDCLNFSKNKKLDIKTTDLHELLEKVLNIADIPQQIKIKKEFYPALPPLQVDTGQIRQVFINIITNAVMAINGPGEIKITTIKGEDYAEIGVTDTGPGIPEQNLKKLFDPFFTTKTHGTGLGLAISKFIIENHGGLIWVENGQNLGSSFFIRLPFEPKQKLMARYEEEALVLA